MKSPRRFRPSVRTLVPTVFALVCLAAFSGPGHVPSDFSDYHTFQELTTALKGAASSHSNLARVESIGKTLGGRDIWMMEVGNRSGTPLAERPALLLAANFEGNEVVGSELALGTVNWLLDQYGSNDEVTKALDEHVFYVIPRMNPDGAEKMFASVQTGSATNTTPYDDDNDARTDEDGPEDLNGDGIISIMRVPDPGGAYMIDPDDARLMKKADPKKGETGAYALYWEGTDNDNDGFYNEDPAGGIDLNRNFQHEYPYYTRGAGMHMVSERESRAMMDFVVGHRNIGMMLVFGPNDNLIKAPNNKGELAPASGIDMFSFADDSWSEAGDVGIFQRSGGFGRFGFGGFGGGGGNQGGGNGGGGGRRPATTVNNADLEYFTTISKKYGEITGIETPPALRNPEGAFFQYGYYQFGVPSFSTPGWGLDKEKNAEADEKTEDDGGNAPGGRGAMGGGRGAMGAGGSGDAFDAKLAGWMDDNGIDGFVAWSAFDHPMLGDIEIGGFKPYEAVNPPMTVIQEQAAKHGKFAAYLASLFAEVRIAKTEVVDHGGGVFRIKAEIENRGFLPTATAHGVVSRSVAPTMVQLGVDSDAILSGDSKTNYFQALDGSGKRQSYEWIIRGRRGDKVDLKVVAQKGGGDSRSITLQ